MLRAGFFTEIYRPVVNGVVTAIDALAGGLRARGHAVYCYAPSIPGEEASTAAVYRIPSLPLPSRAPYRLTLPLLRRSVKDIVKGLDIIHLHSPFVTGWMGLRCARQYGIPAVFTYHTHLEAYAHYSPFDVNASRFAASQLTKTFANLVDAVIVPTQAMADHLRSIGVTTRIEVIPSGINVAHFAGGTRDAVLRARLGASRSTRLLLTVSRLAEEKNVDVLLQALALTKDENLHLVIAGDGPQREELQRRAYDLDVHLRTKFIGIVPRERLPDVYASCDAFVFASTSETQGLVQAEAMASGLPLIVADCATNRDVVGGAGTIVKPTAEAFAAAMRAVGAPGPELAACLKAEAARFNVERQIDGMLWLYRDLAAQHAQHSA